MSCKRLGTSRRGWINNLGRSVDMRQTRWVASLVGLYTCSVMSRYKMVWRKLVDHKSSPSLIQIVKTRQRASRQNMIDRKTFTIVVGLWDGEDGIKIRLR